MSKTDDNQDRQWLHIPSRNSVSSSGGQRDSAMNSHTQSNNIQQPEQKDADNNTPRHNPHGAANVARTQINQIYETNPPHQEESQAQNTNAYDREHGQAAAYDWRNYHTAWQDYYQKYYERYYLQQLHAERQRQSHARADHAAGNTGGGAEQPAARPAQEFRNELLGKVSERAKKARGSTHFLPIVSALVIGLLFLGFNYNKLLAAGVHSYVSPSTQVSDNVIVDPSANVPIGNEPRVIVPKINVDAPLVYGLESLDNATTQVALEDGVVHYPIPGASSLPGQTGNSVFLGHSSNTVFDPGNYKFVFVLLPRLEKGDTYYIHHEGQRYVYRVTKKQVITPDQVSELVIDTDKPMSTLVTCVPIGSNAKRLLVFGEQISPDPSQAERVNNGNNSQPEDISIPGNSETFLDRIFQ